MTEAIQLSVLWCTSTTRIGLTLELQNPQDWSSKWSNSLGQMLRTKTVTTCLCLFNLKSCICIQGFKMNPQKLIIELVKFIRTNIKNKNGNILFCLFNLKSCICIQSFKINPQKLIIELVIFFRTHIRNKNGNYLLI